MAGTARVKLGALALLAMLVLPPRAAAAQERQSEKEWVWGEWDDGKVRAQAERSETKREERRRERQRERRAEKERDKERRERQRVLRREAREQQKSKSGDRDRYQSKYKYKYKYESKYKYEAKYKYKYKSKYASKNRGRDHHHGHRGYGLVYGGRRGHGHHHHDHDHGSVYPDPGPVRPPPVLSIYLARLSGDQVVPQPGPTDASGVANLLLVRDDYRQRGEICYTLGLRGTDTSAPLRVDLHVVGRPAPPVFDLNFAVNRYVGCQKAPPQLVREIEQSPSSYYLDVHTQAHDGGVVRGVLDKV